MCASMDLLRSHSSMLVILRIDPYKNYRAYGPIYRAADGDSYIEIVNQKVFQSFNMVPGFYSLKLSITAFGQSITVDIPQMSCKKFDLGWAFVNILFENVSETEPNEVDETAPLSLERFSSFSLRKSFRASHLSSELC